MCPPCQSISIVTMSIDTLCFIPVIVLTVFHISLVCKGRTTNEQVSSILSPAAARRIREVLISLYFCCTFPAFPFRCLFFSLCTRWKFSTAASIVKLWTPLSHLPLSSISVVYPLCYLLTFLVPFFSLFSLIRFYFFPFSIPLWLLPPHLTFFHFFLFFLKNVIVLISHLPLWHVFFAPFPVVSLCLIRVDTFCSICRNFKVFPQFFKSYFCSLLYSE